MMVVRCLRALVLSTIALLLANTLAYASPPVVMKVLVLAGNTEETSYQSISTILQQIGVPYQAVMLSSITPDASGNRLSKVSLSNSATGQGLYQGIILTDSTFAECGSSSCLSATDWTTLNTYATQFGVRIASYYTYPAAQWGLLPVGSGTSYTAASPLNVTLTTAGAAVFSYLNSANSIPVAGQGSSGITAYLATPTAAAGETTTPLLMAGSYTVAVTHTTASGEEILALTMDDAPTLLHSLAFGYGVVNWVTNGVFLGSRKVYLNPQVDDMLLGNWIYAPTLHPACESAGTCPTYYETGPDLQAMATWQAGVQSNPLFQGFRGTFALNGVGTTWFPADDPVFAAIASLGSQFWWVSHTWDHPNLDCYTVNKSGACVPATLSQSLAELNQDIAVAPKLGITLDQVGMVTPFNSGLSNLSFLQAAAQVGIQYIVYPEYPASPNTGIVNSLVPSILEITRMNNNLFYDASSPSSGVYGSWPDEYNANYGPNGLTPIYSQDQTYSQILNNESQGFLLTNMLTYSPYLLAFHIANTTTYDGVHSLYSDLLDATIAKYENLFTLPVLSVNMETIAGLLTERANYNSSGVTGVYTPGVSVVLTTTNAATIPVTGICSQASCGTYGGQIQDDIVMAANSTVTIPLTANVGVSLSSVSLNPTSVTGGTSSTGTVTLSGAAPSGGVSVSLSSSTTSATVPASVTVAAGSTKATFSVATTAVASSTSATVTASYSGVSTTASLTITPAAVSLSSVSLNPTSVTGGTSSTGTVTLSGAAPSGGASVSLSSNTTSATVPASVTVAAGSTTATFSVATSTVTSSTSATVTASYSSVSKTASLTITPAAVSLSSVSLNPTSVTGGTSSTGTVTLSGTAPSGGVSVSLSSSTTSATVPASVTVAAGSTTATFSVATTAVASPTSATVTAGYSGVSKVASLTITPAPSLTLSSVSVSPTSVASYTSATGTVTLSGSAPNGGVSVTLSSNSSAAVVPATVTVAAGSNTATFTVTTRSVAYTTPVTITASYNGTSSTAPLTIQPSASVALSSVSVSPTSVVTGANATGTVVLSGSAPTGGIVVELWTTGTVAFVPASVTIAAGSTTGTFTVTTNYTTTTLQDTVTAFYNGASKTAGVTVTP